MHRAPPFCTASPVASQLKPTLVARVHGRPSLPLLPMRLRPPGSLVKPEPAIISLSAPLRTIHLVGSEARRQRQRRRTTRAEAPASAPVAPPAVETSPWRQQQQQQQNNRSQRQLPEVQVPHRRPTVQQQQQQQQEQQRPMFFLVENGKGRPCEQASGPWLEAAPRGARGWAMRNAYGAHAHSGNLSHWTPPARRHHPAGEPHHPARPLASPPRPQAPTRRPAPWAAARCWN